MEGLCFFLGRAIDEAMEKELTLLAPFTRKLFTSGDNYLKEVTIGKSRFLGKELVPFLSIEELHLFESHVKSILMKIAPKSSAHNPPLTLFALPDEHPRDSHSPRRRGKAAR